MIRLTWRQFRLQAWISLGLLAIVAILFLSTGPHIAHLYDIYNRAQAACASSGDCREVSIKLSKADALLELIGTALVALPALIGAFWGAPLIAREFENGTQRLVWTQSISRARWISVKLAVVGGASIISTALLSFMVTWWSRPIDHSNANRFGAGLFGERDIVPLGYAAFGFALGVALGLVIRRTLPAMAATLGVFLGIRLAFTYLVRPHLLAPLHLRTPLNTTAIGFGSSNGGAASLFPSDPNLPNAWIFSTRIVDAGGHGLTPATVATSCPTLGQSFPPPPGSGGQIRTVAPAGAHTALQDCVTKLSAAYHQTTTYQPASRYWIFQSFETAIFLVAAALLVVFCLWRIRHRS